MTSESDDEYAVENNDILFEELLSASSSEESMSECEESVPELEGANVSSPRNGRGSETQDSHAPSQSSKHSSRGRGQQSLVVDRAQVEVGEEGALDEDSQNRMM